MLIIVTLTINIIALSAYFVSVISLYLCYLCNWPLGSQTSTYINKRLEYYYCFTVFLCTPYHFRTHFVYLNLFGHKLKLWQCCIINTSYHMASLCNNTSDSSSYQLSTKNPKSNKQIAYPPCCYLTRYQNSFPAKASFLNITQCR